MSKTDGARHRTRIDNSATAGMRVYLADLRECLRDLEVHRVAAIADRLWSVARTGGQIFFAGNGGSAATASHMALDVGKSALGRGPIRPGTLRVRTVALSEPGPVITAWANDHGYEHVFAEQIATLVRPGDAAVLFSVSGNSPNIIAAARAARAAGATVIALLGRPGGAMRELADLALVVPSDDYGIVEDVHLAINHVVTRRLRHAIHATSTLGGPGSQKSSAVAQTSHAAPVRKPQPRNSRRRST